MSSSDTPLDDVLLSVACCPACHGELVTRGDSQQCQSCAARYAVEDGVARLTPASADGPDQAEEFYNVDDEARYGRGEGGMPEPFASLVREFVAGADDLGTVLEVGSGQGAFTGAHRRYIALDYSFVALRRFGAGPRVQADAAALPFRDKSINSVFSVATFEHLPEPEKALSEIDRCLEPGGRVLLFPAWFVRPWASKALNERPYGELSPGERLAKASIPVRDSKPYWLAKVLPGRLRREAKLRSGANGGLGLDYWRLDPNLEEYLTSDSDAFNSLDPQAVAAYFVSRGYRDQRRPSGRQRLLYGYEPVVVQKP